MFKTDTRVYKGEYIFHGQPLHEILVGHSQIVYGHLYTKAANIITNEVLLQNGKISSEGITEIQMLRQQFSYNEWHTYSLTVTNG